MQQQDSLSAIFGKQLTLAHHPKDKDRIPSSIDLLPSSGVYKSKSVNDKSLNAFAQNDCFISELMPKPQSSRQSVKRKVSTKHEAEKLPVDSNTKKLDYYPKRSNIDRKTRKTSAKKQQTIASKSKSESCVSYRNSVGSKNNQRKESTSMPNLQDTNQRALTLKYKSEKPLETVIKRDNRQAWALYRSEILVLNQIAEYFANKKETPKV